MNIRMVEERLMTYRCQSYQEEQNALREITQEIALNALFNAGFFKLAAFQGGTCLRIFYGMNRFSEDLDFALIRPDADFDIQPHMAAVINEFKAFGLDVSVQNRTKRTDVVRNVFLKDESIGKLVDIRHPRPDGTAKSIRIKIEVDTNPPVGASVEQKFHDFPLNFSVTVYDHPSMFAGKCHAILSRKYEKGRDWYDFLWYCSRRIEPNYLFLENALKQQGPWQGQDVHVDRNWFRGELERKISAVDWNAAKSDMHRFVRPNELPSLELWGVDIFLSGLGKLMDAR